MAKRKLSESQRLSVRKDLKKALSGGASNAEALKSVGRKYGINPESVRWYLKELTGNKPGRKPGRPATGRKAAGRKRGRKPGPKAVGASPLLHRAEAAARDKARKATALLRIVPNYRKLQQSETDLRVRIGEIQATEQKLARTLERTAKDRKILEKKLKGLL